MFKRISYTIALQFTAFVFLLLVINGAIFMAAEFGNERRQMRQRLDQSLHFALLQAELPLFQEQAIPVQLRERIRIVDTEGNAIYSGAFFRGIPFSSNRGYSTYALEGDHFRVLTVPIERGGIVVGYAQAADFERLQLRELPERAALYILVSLAISALTFSVGLFFARRSLQPAAQMVERLEQFTQDASHELRTPLAAMLSSLDLALKTKKYEEGIVSAKEDLREISVLTEKLLALARLDTFTLTREEVDLTTLIEQSVERFRPMAAEKKVKIEAEIAKAKTVVGDPALLRQVLSNLLANAIKFSKATGGSIHVTLTDHTLIVRDEGIGIAEDALPHIFDRFYQAETSRSNDGYGLGLSMVKRIVELHGWLIKVKSKEAGGTIFTITIGK